MSTTPTAAPDNAPASKGALARVVGVFWEPGNTFRDIVARPGWWLPLVLMIVIALIFMSVFLTQIGVDAMLQQQMAANSRLQQLSAEQQAQALALQKRIVPPLMFVSVVAIPPLLYLATALVMMFAYRLLADSQVTFKQSFGITVHAFLPSALSAILAIVVIMFVHPADFDVNNPLMTNAAWLLGDAPAAWLKALASSLDLFSLWILALLAIGFATTKRKMGFGQAFLIAAIPWALYVLIKVGATAAFS